MNDEQYKALLEKVKSDFKKEFNYELTDDDVSRGDNGIEIDYRDYDLNMISKYHHNAIVESSRFESDGRCEYIRVTSFIKYEEYF